MVPTEGPPPFLLSTNHETAVFVVPFTVAWNWWVAPPGIVSEDASKVIFT